jgi:hypothetical protein
MRDAASTGLVDALCRASRRDAGLVPEALDWPESVAGAWCFSPERISIHGTAAYEALDEDGRKRLSLLEAVSFFSINVHGERLLIEGLARRLQRPETQAYTRYLHHFLAEENRHLECFGEFCRRYAGGVYPEKKVALAPIDPASHDDFVFFARVLLFEEIVDGYNRAMARDERLHPLLRRINALHHQDERRHLAFGRQLAHEIWREHAPGWSAEERRRLQDDLRLFLESTWHEYYNPDVYRDAGLADVFRVRAEGWGTHRARRRAASEEATRFLVRAGILESEEAA